ncbi:MAG TPA: hypothetical protein VEF05_08550 [Terriglobales bacterium]|nr:hypothetical protein [Terriglobales bacterium]
MKFLGVLSVLCSLTSGSFALDREAFTFTNYDLNVRVEPEQQRLGVRGKITLRNDSAKPQTSFVLQISSSLDWKSIRVSGKAAHFVTQEYNSDIDHTGALSEAIVDLPQAIAPKGTVELEVGYEGVIPLDTSRLTRIGVPQDKATHTDWDQISKSFTAVRGIGYVIWYPVATEDASLTDGDSMGETVGRWKVRHVDTVMHLLFESTANTPIFFSGTPSLFAVQPDHGIAKVAAYTMVRPGVSVPTFVIADYTSLKPDDFTTVGYLAGQQDAAETYAEVGTKVGPVVPIGRGSKDLNILGLPDPDAQPFVTEGMLLTPLNSPMTNEAELSIVYAEERQAVESPRLWIQDGLAHFAQAEFVEKQKGRQAALEYLTSHSTALIALEKTHGGQALLNAPEDLYLQTKAMYVWWMLKDMLGKLPVEALLDYQAADDRDPSYLPKLIEKRSQRDLQWFFDDWVYHDRGLPDFRVESVFSTPLETGGFLVTITVENLGDAGAEVPLTVQFDGGEIRRRLEVHAKSKASVRMEAPAAPQQVTVNDGSVPESDTSNNIYKVEGVNH